MNGIGDQLGNRRINAKKMSLVERDEAGIYSPLSTQTMRIEYKTECPRDQNIAYSGCSSLDSRNLLIEWQEI